jgi:uncharacterized membrane protein
MFSEIVWKFYIWLYLILGILISIISLVILHFCKKDISIGLILSYIFYSTIWPIYLYVSALNYARDNMDKIEECFRAFGERICAFFNIVVFKGRK